MKKIKLRGIRILVLGATAWISSAKVAIAQTPSAAKPNVQTAGDPNTPVKYKRPAIEGEHRFWDKENTWLIVGVGAGRTLDYFSTLNMRRRGRQEIFLTNDVVDNHAAFAALEASAMMVSVGGSYLFHHYGHHKLERWTSFVHIGLATTGAARNYCLKTAHFEVTPSTP